MSGQKENEKQKRRIKITFDDLVRAFEMNSTDTTQYLNLETGGIVMISELFDSFDEEGNQIEDPETYIDNEKYIPIPNIEAYEAFEYMEDFIKTVKNPKLSSLLENTIQKKRPFRNFKDKLLNYPEEQDRWFKYQEAQTRERVLDWLKENDLELV